MRSLYLGILLAMAIILALSVLVFLGISHAIEQKYFTPVFDAMDEVEVQDAREMLETSGPDAVAAYMHRLNSVFGGSHYLLDANGKDIVTGEDRSALVPRSPLTKWRGQVNGKALVMHRSADGRYWFVAVSTAQPRRAPYYRYYLLVVGATAVLCWLAAVGVVVPIRQITSTIEQFGRGNLSARVKTDRRDEIGTLGRSFNSMAERLEKLVLTEHRLLEDISHELRSPLARLNFSVKLARTASDRDAALDRVKRDIDRLTTLVSELVEMTRVEGDPACRKSEIVCMNGVISETVRDACIEVEARGCSVNVDGELTTKVMGDRELLRRAVENVLRNAVRYSPPKAKIDILLKEKDKTASITVRDYGSGIPEAFLDKIFDPFFRVEEARDSETGGVGLGLSIAKRAVQLHNGTILARNSNPGLSVEITLPVAHESIDENQVNISNAVSSINNS